MNVFYVTSQKGLIISLTVILSWILSLVILLRIDLFNFPKIFILLLLLWQTFLYTGLFITAHDGMHGTIYSRNRSVNDFIGKISVFFYALFSYKKLVKKHLAHHRHPGTAADPDFHDGVHDNFFLWYIQFFRNYVGLKQLIGMALIFNILHYLFGVNNLNLFLFWVCPSLLSTLQLFYFGTYLPHRELEEPFPDHHRTRSTDLNVVWSFLTCYFFGYHWEHHAHPGINWWSLPRIRKQVQ